MPLTGYVDSERVVGPLLSSDAWAAVRGLDVRLQCGAKAVPKRSRAGTQFFAHWPASHCDVAHPPESADHLSAKEAILRAAIAAGWEAALEVPADDRSWVADVLVTDGARRIAIEVQWSQQTSEEYTARQDRYLKAGIDCYWFARHHKSANNGLSRIPIFELHGNRDGFGAAHGWYTGNTDGPPGRHKPRSPAADPLAHLVTSLLSGYPRRWIPLSEQRRGVRVYWAWSKCKPCETWMQLWTASDPLFRCLECQEITERQVPGEKPSLYYEPSKSPRELDPDVMNAVKRLPKPAVIIDQFGGQAAAPCYSFACPKCVTPILLEVLAQKRWNEGQSETVRSPTAPISAASGGHWCRVTSG